MQRQSLMRKSHQLPLYKNGKINSHAATTSDQLKFQEFAQDASLDATNRQIVGDYFSKFAAITAPDQRAEFMDVLDAELGPPDPVPLAVRLLKARQVRDEICQGRLAALFRN